MDGHAPKRGPTGPMGRAGEQHAARYLARRGYAILERNVRLGRYEIDIIAADGDTIVFVEVKARQATDVADPEDNITRAKRRNLLAAAQAYISRTDAVSECFYRFDVVTVNYGARKGRPPEIKLYRDAFRADEC